MIKSRSDQAVLVVVGSGTGGHVTPINPIVKAIRKKNKNLKVVYIGQTGDKFSEMIDSNLIDEKTGVISGKWRRYHGEGWRQLLDLKTLFLNIRDFFFVSFGTAVAYFKLRSIKPNAVFVNGGPVGVPVGLAAAAHKIPIITHDSDSTAGLVNRIIARWAVEHAVAMDPKNYDYPADDTTKVGIPIQDEFYHVKKTAINRLRKKHGLKADKETLLVLGGSLGAERINEAIEANAKELLKKYQIVHVMGKNNYKDSLNNPEKGYIALDFIRADMPAYIGLADLVITRAGATALTEICAVKRPMIIIPGSHLADNHQKRNGEYYSKSGAAVCLTEAELRKNPRLLLEAVSSLLSSNFDSKAMLQAQTKTLVKDSAGKIAKLINRYLKVKDGGQKK